MSLPIPLIDRDKQVDDEWTVADANTIPRFSERVEEAGRREHTASGEHLIPGPEAVGRIVWDGFDFSLEWGAGISSVGVGGSSNEVEITLDNIMVPDSVGAFWMPDDEDLTGAIVVSVGTTQVVLQLYHSNGNAVSRSGFVQIYGERLTP